MQDKRETPADATPRQRATLNISAESPPPEVPVFTCIVYVSTKADDGVRARVMNLRGIECTAATEREALAKLVAQFKQRISESMQSGNPIPWIEPLPPRESGEQERVIPVHL